MGAGVGTTCASRVGRFVRVVGSTLLGSALGLSQAATFTVTTLNDSGPGSLRDAVAQANSNPGPDTVNFAVTGTIVLTSGQIQIVDALTIVGPGAASLTIDGNANNRIFLIEETSPPGCPALTGPADYLVTISGLALTNAHRNTDNPGGAIWTAHSLTLDGVVVRDNAAKAGGGLSFNTQYAGQALTIRNSFFDHNLAVALSPVTSNQDGGALRVVENCSGANINTAIPVTVTISNTTFSHNHAQPQAGFSGRGGAIFSSAYVDITIDDSRIVKNSVDVPNPSSASAAYQGGAFRGYAKSLTIRRSEIAQNSVLDPAPSGLTRSGALHLFNSDSNLQSAPDATVFNVVDSTISGNSVSDAAGAMVIFGNVDAQLRNTTIADNSAAPAQAGGVLVSTGAGLATPALTLASTILANDTGADLGTNTTFIPTYTVTADHSLVRTPCGACSITLSGSGNLTAVDPLIGALAFDGGYTRTHALLAGSPAIDAGSNALALANDQRGGAFARVLGAAADIGAYETNGIVARSLVPDGTSLQQDFAAFPDTRWFAIPVEPGKTYVIEAADTDGDLTANSIGALNVYGTDGVSPPPEAVVDCNAANGDRPPAVDVNVDGIRCIVRTAPPNATMLNQRPVYIRVVRNSAAAGGGSQFRVRAREATIYGRWATAGYDYHVEIENTTADAMCVEVTRYPASGLAWAPATGWSGSVKTFTMTVPGFGAVKNVFTTGDSVGADGEGTLRLGACASPTNFVAAALHASTYAFNTAANRYIYFFTSSANDGRTRSTW